MSNKVAGIIAEVMAQLRVQFHEGTPLGGAVPIERIQHRIGAEVVLDGFDGNDDCDALVWVSILRRYRTVDFPSEAYEIDNCRVGKAITIVVGIARCTSMMDDYGNPPDPDQVAHEAVVGIDDSSRLDAALCRAGRVLEDDGRANGFALDAAEPMGPSGGIVAWVQQASFRL